MATTYAFSSQPKPWISGMPNVAIKDLDGEKVLRAAVAATLVEGRKSLDSDMQTGPWKEYQGMVSLDWDGSDFVYSFVGTDAEIAAMRGLENGLPGTPAVPLLARSVFRLQDRVNDAVATAAAEVVSIG